MDRRSRVTRDSHFIYYNGWRVCCPLEQIADFYNRRNDEEKCMCICVRKRGIFAHISSRIIGIICRLLRSCSTFLFSRSNKFSLSFALFYFRALNTFILLQLKSVFFFPGGFCVYNVNDLFGMGLIFEYAFNKQNKIL